MTDPNKMQVGGTHYQTGDKPQHWDLVLLYEWDYFQGQITKYLMRWKFKHDTPEKRLEDLKKARHFLDKYIAEQESKNGPAPGKSTLERPDILVKAEYGDDAEGNVWWQLEGHYGNGLNLYSCRQCKSAVRMAAAPAVGHGCNGVKPQHLP